MEVLSSFRFFIKSSVEARVIGSYSMTSDNEKSETCHLPVDTINIPNTQETSLFLADNLSRLCQQHPLTFHQWHNKLILSSQMQVQKYMNHCFLHSQHGSTRRV